MSASIRINLLPHREMRRERRKKDFVGLVALIVIATAGVAFIVGMGIDQQISSQTGRNNFIKAENAKLDTQIKEIASLREDIAALKARQNAVETLQSDRTTPVHVLDELVKQTPEGIFLKQVKQDDRRVTLIGVAQSNERVSELLRNLSTGTEWLERPDLIEIKAVPLTAPGQAVRPQDRDSAKQVYEFSMVAYIKTPAAASDAAAAKSAQTSAPTVASASGLPRGAH